MKAFSFLMVFLSVALAQAFLAPATFQVPRAMVSAFVLSS
jgi:hypothetical protein